MRDLSIDHLQREHVSVVAETVAATARSHQESGLEIVGALTSSSAVADMLEEIRGGYSFVALSSGSPIGFITAVGVPLFGEEGGYVPEYGFSSPAPEVTTELYTALANRLSYRDRHLHVVNLWSDADKQTWHELGFGRVSSEATRTPQPLPAANTPVQRADSGDAVTVHAMEEALWDYLAAAPIFRVHPHPDDVRTIAKALNDDRTPTWLALESGQPVGFLSLNADAAEAVALDTPRVVHCTGAFVDPSARLRGFGSSLLGAALEWAGDTGYKAIALDYESANRSAAAFWARLGFRPVLHTLARRTY